MNQVVSANASTTAKTAATATIMQTVRPECVRIINASSATGTLINDFANLFEEKNFADFTFVVEGTEFAVHKAIISARCDVFATMLQNDMKEKRENRAVIDDISAVCFKEMLRFIYTSEANISSELAADLFKAAHKYNLSELKKRCEDTLIRGLNSENAVTTFQLADLFSSEEMKTRTIKYIMENKAAVMKSENWKKFISTNSCAKLVWDVCNYPVPVWPTAITLPSTKRVLVPALPAAQVVRLSAHDIRIIGQPQTNLRKRLSEALTPTKSTRR